MFKNNNKSNNVESTSKHSLKEAFFDTFGVYGKCFIAGLSVVGAVMAVKDAVKANDDLRRKYNA